MFTHPVLHMLLLIPPPIIELWLPEILLFKPPPITLVYAVLFIVLHLPPPIKLPVEEPKIALPDPPAMVEKS